jgi:hypothetical protein
MPPPSFLGMKYKGASKACAQALLARTPKASPADPYAVAHGRIHRVNLLPVFHFCLSVFGLSYKLMITVLELT